MRRIVVLTVVLAAVVGLVFAQRTDAALTLGQKLRGRILLQVQSGGSGWYVSPLNFQRYHLGNATTSQAIVQKLSLAVSQANLDGLPISGSTAAGNLALRQKLAGRILRLSGTTQMWYVSPVTLQRTALDTNPLTALKKLGLGVSDANLKLIPIAVGYDAPKVPVNGLLRVQKSVVTVRGTYTVDVMTLTADTTTLKVMTDTAQSADCKTNCRTISLKAFVDQRKAVAGMHGTYFCPYDYASCAGQTGYYFYAVFNSFSRVMVNEVRMKYTTQPIVAIDTTNRFFLYAPTLQFHSLAELKAKLKVDSEAAGGSGVLRAAISNSPIMVEKGKNVLNTKFLDTKQATVKSYRGFLGWKGRTITFGIVRGATVTDAAAVATALGLDYALNLDGGGTTALYQGGGYVIGPGRNLPNAILLVP